LKASNGEKDATDVFLARMLSALATYILADLGKI
jgi:hypothetical protein